MVDDSGWSKWYYDNRGQVIIETTNSGQVQSFAYDDAALVPPGALGRFLPQSQVAIIALGGNPPLLNGRPHSASRLVCVAAIAKVALGHQGCNLDEIGIEFIGLDIP